MKKYVFIFFAVVSITLLVFIGWNKINNNRLDIQQIIETDQFRCQSDSDCQVTCANGCVNSDWMKNRGDCLALRNITCTCVNGQCKDKELKSVQLPE